MKSPLTRRVGMNICRLRMARDWTQMQLATEADVDMSTVQRNESGRVLPNGCDMLKLAIVLKVGVDDLFHGVPRDLDEVKRMHPRKARV